jgi:hypothetical protein
MYYRTVVRVATDHLWLGLKAVVGVTPTTRANYRLVSHQPK